MDFKGIMGLFCMYCTGPTISCIGCGLGTDGKKAVV